MEGSSLPMTGRPVLLTGASGLLGRLLAARLGALGWPLRLTDVRDFLDPLPPGATFTQLDLEDRAGVLAVAEGCGLILHFGGVSTEQSFDAILGPNLRGTFHIYEAARREKARVVYASSVHVVGLYERSAKLDQDCALRPDGYYGLSKAYGEMLARMYWEKHSVESVLIRIGSTLPKPTNERFLATWLSHDDFVSLIASSRTAERVGCAIVWGASDNSRSFWRHDARDVIGWAPRDSSDDHLDGAIGRVTEDPVAERFQGGVFVSVDYTRDGYPPSEMYAAV
jgi:uronate dehydrogenase